MRLPALLGAHPHAGGAMSASVTVDLSLLWLALSDPPGGSGTGGGSSSGGSGPDPDELERVRALVVLAQGGDQDAFGQLYQRYVQVVYRYIYVRVGSVHTAQDLTSETFIKALRNLSGFTWQGKDIAAWFVTIARNVVNDHAKSSRFRLEVTTEDMRDADTEVEAPEGEVLQRMRDERLLQAVAQLRPEQAECVTLRFVQGLSLAETAEVMGKKENAVKQLQLRAVRALQRALEGEDL
ncbi:sigma-70 family RNA polymerase sigma factor [Arsenicicoccus bolidensis]|uniref:Sigma-70 family RNA polymerase sigma factor n=1 Tax=Arsenicicoccus bolidensis TaxID=229480 RepID=A0ABS9Q0K9_9MICO|nr:sigma-70 family RNA polymerase sigma factor [Arsenicicoccus bolidensis]MCG7321391.1 sigma-70 family RNA polymerase sigma factor [Arsenicicoccus bolidensis]